MSKQNHGSTVRHNVNAVALRLNGSPDTANEWQTIARQLRQAADAARKIAILAGAMHERAEVDAAYYRPFQSHEAAR